VRALLDLMRKHKTRVQEMHTACASMLEHASRFLDILDPEGGEEELIKAVAAELATLRALSRSV
jgi:hypothetical protein